MTIFPHLYVRPRLVSPVVSVLKRTLHEAATDRIPSVAAGITFFVLLAMFPAIAAVVSLYGIFADRASIGPVIHATAPFVPDGVTDVLNTELHRLIVERAEKLNFAFVTGLLIALWSASGGMRALVEGLNVAFEVRETRGYLRVILDALLFTGSAIMLMTGIVALAVIAPVVLHHLPMEPEFRFAFEILRMPLLYACCAALVGAIYRYGPSRARERTHLISWGSTAVALLWILTTFAFAWYAHVFGSYDRVYGSLGAAVGVLTWIWLLLIILLVGAELDGEIEKAWPYQPAL
jgi:membrane protein